MKKPITPAMHGIADYAVAGLQMTLPKLIDLPPENTILYRALGGGYTLVNGTSDTSAAATRLIPFKTHQKLDAGLIAGLALLTFKKSIREDKKSLIFHLSLIGVLALSFALTDYDDMAAALRNPI